MSRDINKIIVIDLEAACWAPGERKGDPEIIEVGLAVLDTGDLTVGHRESILVRPSAPVSPFCTGLTSITNDMLDRDGVSLAEAVAKLEAIAGQNQPWASFGAYDDRKLRSSIREHNGRAREARSWRGGAAGGYGLHRGNLSFEFEDFAPAPAPSLRFPFGDTHYNVRNLVAMAFGLATEPDIPRACDLLGVERVGHLHRGVDDAVSIARVLGAALRRIRG